VEGPGRIRPRAARGGGRDRAPVAGLGGARAAEWAREQRRLVRARAYRRTWAGADGSFLNDLERVIAVKDFPPGGTAALACSRYMTSRQNDF
jgi:hypothetical protein